jgi:hypothetical protein
METGDIVFGINNHEGKHPMVFLYDIDEYVFQGVMLTHSAGRGNVLLLPEHYSYVSNGFDVTRTHLVRRSLIKKKEWEPFVKVAKLSEVGLEFVKSNIKGQEPSYW